MSNHNHLSFGICAFDCSIRVDCSSVEARDLLQRYLLPPLPRTEAIPASPDVHLSVADDAGSFRVQVNQNPPTTAATLHDAALAAVKALDDALIHSMHGLHAIHAGAVLIEGRALLIPGSTHAGKSSLVAELLRRGASHFSDEYALIDRDGRAHSYPRPLLLRNGQPFQTLVLPEALNATFATEPARVRWILALDYAAGGEWKIRELSQSEAVMLLLRNTPHELAQSPCMVDSFVRVAENAVCYEGQRGDAVGAASRILDLITQK